MSYKFSREEQKELMQMIMYYRDMRYNKVQMLGFRKDLVKVQAKLDDLLNDIFEMGYPLMDAPYHCGWSGEALEDVYKILDRMGSIARELYAVVLVGLGEGGAPLKEMEE